jgi:hypothetical protein
MGRYTHRVAISNHRIVRLQDNHVTFLWKDYNDNHRQKYMTVHVYEFIRRFLLHVLPSGFFKIRYYGILANRNKKIKLDQCKYLFKLDKTNDISSIDWIELFAELTGIDLRVCHNAKKGG